MDVVQRRAALYLVALFSALGCGGKKKAASLVAMDEVVAWAKTNACVSGNVNASDTLAGAQFTCVKPLGECGCRAVISARSKSGGRDADSVEILVANCRREVGSRAAKDIVVHLLDSLVAMDVDRPLHENEGDAPVTAASVVHHYQDRDHPDRDATMEWTKDVFADGKPQRTETYKIVVSTPATAGDHKMTWSETPTVTTAPACASHPPTDEDMARIPESTAIPVRLRCPPAASDVTVPAFEIDRHLVTCEQYSACVDAHACSDEPDDCALAAVVSHHSAEAYCAWRHARLPTLREWQRAVRGSEANLYPSGSEWDPVSGCRVPTLKNAAAGLVRCENTNVDGITYYVLDRNGEWTHDDDCVAPKDPTQRQPLALLLGIEALGRAAPVPETDHQQFRCARPHGAQ